MLFRTHKSDLTNSQTMWNKISSAVFKEKSSLKIAPPSEEYTQLFMVPLFIFMYIKLEENY